MASPLSPSKFSVAPDERPHDPSAATVRSFHRSNQHNRLLFFLTAWLIVLMPFLFWWSTWFGRPLSNKQIGEYLNDEKHPRHIQHALVQLGERMARHDPSARRWYAETVQLASHSVEEVRNTDAWVMGQDPSSQAFHATLLRMLQDRSITVRGNAALSLVRFGDSSGRTQIVGLLKSASITAPAAGRVLDIDKSGTSIHQDGLVARLQDGQRTIEVRSPISGRVHTPIAVGTDVAQGTELAVVDPADDQVWEALRALYLVGQPEDLPSIRRYEAELSDSSDRVHQQATLTERAILERAKTRP